MKNVKEPCFMHHWLYLIHLIKALVKCICHLYEHAEKNPTKPIHIFEMEKYFYKFYENHAVSPVDFVQCVRWRQFLTRIAFPRCSTDSVLRFKTIDTSPDS